MTRSVPTSPFRAVNLQVGVEEWMWVVEWWAGESPDETPPGCPD